MEQFAEQEIPISAERDISDWKTCAEMNKDCHPRQPSRESTADCP